MNDPALLWADPRLVYTVAATAVALLLVTLWLFGRRKKQGRQAAVICLMVSIVLHIALFFLVPMLPSGNGGSITQDPTTDQEAGIETIEFSSFDPDMLPADASGTGDEMISPLPVADLTDLLTAKTADITDEATDEDSTEPPDEMVPNAEVVPETLAAPTGVMADIDTEIGGMLEDVFASEEMVAAAGQSETATPAQASGNPSTAPPNAAAASSRPQAVAAAASVPGALQNDFANRVGKAKEIALLQTGGSVQTEAAVEAALKFLVSAQRADGAWDPRASGAGRENRSILGVRRPGTGANAESAITGLALLTLMGSGQTHQNGEYADNVYRGLAYLIQKQAPNGSLAGQASAYAANYSHGMAALAMCEAAAITGDAAAIDSAARAIRFTLSQQHPTTGGWRYLPNDRGDLSQLGWQAMVLDAGNRAKIPIDRRAVTGIQRFLQSVRKGQSGGLASYRPEEGASRTMTAEALATRLLIGETVPDAEVAEAERYLLQQPPGVGQDNYYYWYYCTIALHQLQDDAWRTWNEALQRRLLMTQRADGSWSANTTWGGYGGTVYTTSMATLCLESYYRHAIRKNDGRIAQLPDR